MGMRLTQTSLEWAARRRESLVVATFALILCTAYVAARFVPNTWIVADCRFFLNVNTTLVENGTLDQHRFASSWYNGNLGWNRNLDEAWSNVALGRHGEYWPKHPIAISLLSTPLYLCFGVLGSLIFNVLVFAFLAGAVYFMLRAYASAAASAAVVLMFLLASGVTNQLYNFNGDVLLAALLAGAFVATEVELGALAGVLFAIGLTIKPTAILLAPVMFAINARSHSWRKVMLQALLGGGVVVGAYAILNTWMFGAPWLTGYARTLIVVNGEPQIASHAAAFDTPLQQGLERTGGYLRREFFLFWPVFVGIPLFLKKRPLLAIASALGAVATLYAFSLYRYEGERFLFPAVLVCLPAAALGLDSLAALVMLPLSSSRRSLHQNAIVAAVAAVVVALTPMAVRAELADYLRNDSFALVRVGGVAVCVYLASMWLSKHRLSVVGPLAAFATVLIPHAASGWQESGWGYIVAAFLLFAAISWQRRSWIPLTVTTAMGLGLAFYSRADTATNTILGALTPLDMVSSARAVILYAVLALCAVLVAWRIPRVKSAWFALAVLLFVPSIGWADRPTAIGLFALTTPLVLFSVFVARAFGPVFTRQSNALRILAVSCIILCVVGAARRTVAANAPFELESHRSVRHAEVKLGNIPCDFLAWERMSWECAQIDHGLRSMVGLAVSDPPRVLGQEVHMLRIPAPPRQTRTVAWHDVMISNRFEVRYAVPDDARGDVEFQIKIGNLPVETVSVPVSTDSQILVYRIDTHELRGRASDVMLSVHALSGPSEIVVAGGVRD